MSTYGRETRVCHKDIPSGYEVTLHEIRGYDSPDKRFVCTGPGDWKRLYGTKRYAIEACQRHAELRLPNVPDEKGVLNCYLCGGVQDVRWTCPLCEGTNEVHVATMATSDDGRIRLAAIAGPMLRDGVLPSWMKLLPKNVQGDVETLARNPCNSCGSWLLDPEWVGSAYCSRRCCVEDHKVNPTYASMMLKGYDEERRKR